MIAGSLAVIGIAWGVVALLVFRRVTNHSALRVVTKRIYAHLLGIRLYSEEPSLVWKAQRALLADNLRFLGLVAKPALIMAIPFVLLFGSLDAIYGRGPLAVGRAAIVAISADEDAGYGLICPPGIAVETPPVRDFAERRIRWRIRPSIPVKGILRVTSPAHGDLSRSVSAGGEMIELHRAEQSGIAVDYPREGVSVAGISLPWLAWFVIFSCLGAGVFALAG